MRTALGFTSAPRSTSHLGGNAIAAPPAGYRRGQGRCSSGPRGFPDVHLTSPWPTARLAAPYGLLEAMGGVGESARPPHNRIPPSLSLCLSHEFWGWAHIAIRPTSTSIRSPNGHERSSSACHGAHPRGFYNADPGHDLHRPRCRVARDRTSAQTQGVAWGEICRTRAARRSARTSMAGRWDCHGVKFRRQRGRAGRARIYRR